jgi:ribosome maturation factor RimP
MSEIIEKIYSLIEPLLDGTDMFVVNIKIKPTNNVKVFIDADSGFSVEKSILVNRRLYAAITEAAMFPDDDFSLEVSSPGVDEPLLQFRQYKKNVGRKITLTLANDTELTGMMLDVNEAAITLEHKKPKEKVAQTTEIPFAEIKKAIIQVIF